MHLRHLLSQQVRCCPFGVHLKTLSHSKPDESVTSMNDHHFEGLVLRLAPRRIVFQDLLTACLFYPIFIKSYLRSLFYFSALLSSPILSYRAHSICSTSHRAKRIGGLNTALLSSISSFLCTIKSYLASP